MLVKIQRTERVGNGAEDPDHKTQKVRAALREEPRINEDRADL